METTYPEKVDEWEQLLQGLENTHARLLMEGVIDSLGWAKAMRKWSATNGLAEELLTELKSWREQAAGHEASRALLQERFDDTAQQLREVSSRLSWLEENAKRMYTYLEEQATCPECGCFDLCCEDCDYLDTEYPETVAKARGALNGFAL